MDLYEIFSNLKNTFKSKGYQMDYFIYVVSNEFKNNLKEI